MTTAETNSPATFVREVIARYRGARRKSFKISKAECAAVFLRSVIKDNTREHFVALYLCGGHYVVSYSVISVGTANSTQVHPREVFQLAILAGACAIIVAHNHPSGQLIASEEDHRVTKLLVDAGKLLGIPVLDHLILTDDGMFSFAANGLIRES